MADDKPPTSQKVWDDSEFTDEENIESRQSIAKLITAMKKLGGNRRADLLLETIPMIQSKQWAVEWANLAAERRRNGLKHPDGTIQMGKAVLHFMNREKSGKYSHVFLDEHGAKQYLTMAKEAVVKGELQIVAGPLDSFKFGGREYYPMLFFERSTIDKFAKYMPVESSTHAFAVMNMLTMARVHVFFARKVRDDYVKYFAKLSKPWAEPLFAEILTEHENKKLRSFVRTAAALGQSRVLLSRDTDWAPEPVTEPVTEPVDEKPIDEKPAVVEVSN